MASENQSCALLTFLGHPADEQSQSPAIDFAPMDIWEFERLLRSLTDRQMETLQLIAQGFFNKEIAHHLGVTNATAKAHVSEVIRKLKARSRTQAAVSYALQNERRHSNPVPSKGN